jgi:two-component system nitrogen regulation sensor histidine kinase NtrY
VNAEAAIPVESRPRWRRQLTVTVRRYGIIPLFEIGPLVGLLATVAATYFIVIRTGRPETPLSPQTIAVLLVANLVPAMALMVMVARRLAIRRAALSEIGGKGRLHVRLVAIFSIIASVPTLLVVIFASMLFQSGVKFWFSDQARTVLASAENVSQTYARDRERVKLMSGDGCGCRKPYQQVRHRKRGVQ